MRADHGPHMMIQWGCPETVGAAGKITRLCLLRTPIRNLGEPEFQQLLRQLGWYEKALKWFAASCPRGHHHGENLLGLLVYQFFRDVILKDDLRPRCERGYRPQCAEYCIKREIHRDAKPREK